MNKRINRNIYRALLLISFVVINALVLYGISAVLSYLNTGADKSTILHLQAKINESYLPKIVWENLENEGRPMEKQTLQEIEKDYLSAWYVRNIGYKNNSIYGIADYYTDSARVKLYQNIALNKKNKITINTTTIEHHPSLDFYSLDGTLVVFTDTNVVSYEETIKGTNVIARKKDTISYNVMMLLEDGFWRIRHKVALAPKKIPLEKNVITFSLEELNHIRGINYYPKESPWNMFGKQFKDTVIAEDFKKVKKMGLPTIRIFIPYEDFGKAEVSLGKLEKLERTLDIAAENNCKVLITLFDFYGNYDIIDWTLTHRHAETIVKRFKNHKAVIGWDIKNEPDLDFKSRGKEKVLAWLDQMLLNIKKWDPNHAVTIGWSSPEAAIHLATKVDFVSFHYYKKAATFKESYTKLRNVISDKPIVLGEYGISSYSGIWNLFSGSETKQANYYKEMNAVLTEEEIPYLFWTLYDFEKVPNTVTGRLPWRKNPQKYYGCIDSNGKEKESIKYLYK